MGQTRCAQDQGECEGDEVDRRRAPYFRPGASRAPFGSEIEFATASSSSDEKLKSLSQSTHTVMMKTPPISRNALMIWTQVVPFMPPTRT